MSTAFPRKLQILQSVAKVLYIDSQTYTSLKRIIGWSAKHTTYSVRLKNLFKNVEK